MVLRQTQTLSPHPLSLSLHNSVTLCITLYNYISRRQPSLYGAFWTIGIQEPPAGGQQAVESHAKVTRALSSAVVDAQEPAYLEVTFFIFLTLCGRSSTWHCLRCETG